MDKAELIEVILTELKELCEETEIDASDVDPTSNAATTGNCSADDRASSTSSTIGISG